MVSFKIKNCSESDSFLPKSLMCDILETTKISSWVPYSWYHGRWSSIRESKQIKSCLQTDNLLTEKLINLIMIHGKKAKALSIFYKTLNKFENKLLTLSKFQTSDEKKNLLVKQALFQAIENVKPSLEVRKVRVARMTYQVPAILTLNRKQNLAIRWLLDSAKKRKKMSKMEFAECLALELFDAFNKQGGARKKRDELHKLTEINRAYIRYRWW